MAEGGQHAGAWLTKDGNVLAAAEVADDRKSRRVGVRGREALRGALVLTPCRQVHSFGVHFPLDVAFCASDGTVIRTLTLAPRRITRPVLSARFVIEAEAGAFDRWHLEPGDQVEILVGRGDAETGDA